MEVSNLVMAIDGASIPICVNLLISNYDDLKKASDSGRKAECVKRLEAAKLLEQKLNSFAGIGFEINRSDIIGVIYYSVN